MFVDVLVSTHKHAGNRSNHVMHVVGINKNKRYLLLKNSWGPKFGDNGHARVSFDYVRKAGAGVLFVILKPRGAHKGPFT